MLIADHIAEQEILKKYDHGLQLDNNHYLELEPAC